MVLRWLGYALAGCLVLASPAKGEIRNDTSEDVLLFVEDNLLSIFYHELGHALIHIKRLPIYGQEEDAADVLSVLLLDQFFEEESVVQIVYSTAFGFLGEVEVRQNADVQPAYWDVHGPDLQRYYNHICLFYGANPDERDDVARDLGLPEERAWTCPEEFQLAIDSWGAVLDDIASPNGGRSFVEGYMQENSPAAELTTVLIREEIEALNFDYRLPSRLTISVEDCGEANAFFDPEAVQIIMCTEFADYLAEIAPTF